MEASKKDKVKNKKSNTTKKLVKPVKKSIPKKTKKQEVKQETLNKKTALNDKQKHETSNKKTITNNKLKHRIYVGYLTKVVLILTLSIILIIVGINYLIKSINVLSVSNVTYKEKSNLDYKVFLKNNEFYESEYLGKGMSYVASLIDRITADFNYTFEIDKESKIDFDYNITAELVISDTVKENIFLKKEYVLLDNKKEEMVSERIHNINQTINIDYDYYNRIANSFRTKYGVDTKSDLNIYLNINEKNKESNPFELKNKSVMSLTIPLSQKAINISLDYKDINNTSQVIKDPQVIVNNYIYVAAGIVLILFGLLELAHLIQLLLLIKTKKSKYDTYVNGILNEYDRLIVETTTQPNTQDKNTIKINKFSELLDVRDNLKLPIKYFVVTEHQKCQFYIDHEDEVYILTIKEVDLEEKGLK